MGGVSRGIRHCFEIFLFGLILYLIIGQIAMPSEMDSADYAQDISKSWSWYQVNEDGSKREMKSAYDTVNAEVVTIETVLPDEIPTGSCIGSRSSRQSIKVYIDGVLRCVYDTSDTALFGNTSASGYYNVPISREDAGKSLQIEIEAPGIYKGVKNKFYIGTQYGIWMEYVKNFKLSLALSIFLLAFSGLAVIVGLLILRTYKVAVNFLPLSLAIMDSSLFVLCNNMLRQTIFDNISIASDVALFSSVTLVIPFVFYLEQIQECRHQKAFLRAEITGCVVAVICILLYVTGICGMLITSAIGALSVLAGIVFCEIMVALEIKSGDAKKYKANAVSVILLAPLFAIESLSAYFGYNIDTTALFCFGLIAILCLNVYEEVKKIVAIRNEVIDATNASRSKSAFLANMSHEIRTPINGILGMNEMILRETSDASVRDYAENIRSSGKHLLGVVNDILDFSKIESGKMEINPDEYSVSSMVCDIAMLLKERGEKKNLKANVLISPNLPSKLNGDEMRVKQIAINIVSNAVKYTDEGSVALAISGQEQNDSYILKIVVKDTGIGIREEELDKLFEKFARIDEKHNATIEGTGLGMSITKSLIDAMDGTIKVESTFGKGSTFTVEIPQKIVDITPIGNYQVTMEKEHVEEEKKTTKKFIAPDARVLVVDDVSINRSVIKGLLKKTQIQVDMAGSGPEALQMCNKVKYDLILMDHKMPDMDGVETFHFLRNTSGKNQKTHVVVLTANAIAGMKEQYIKEGFDDYLSKPVEPVLLEETLLRYLPKLMIEYVEELEES